MVMVSNFYILSQSYQNTIVYMVKILKLTPFYYMENVSFNIYNGYIANGQEIFKIIVLQILWLIVLTILGKKLMNRQLSKIVVQGG